MVWSSLLKVKPLKLSRLFNSTNLSWKIVKIIKCMLYTFPYLYLISICSLPASRNIVGITMSFVWGTVSLYGLTVRTWVQGRKNPESPTIPFLIWVLIKAFKLCQDVELICNDHLWMRVQNGGYKTVAISRIANKQHKRFNAIVRRITLEVQFLWKEEQLRHISKVLILSYLILSFHIFSYLSYFILA